MSSRIQSLKSFLVPKVRHFVTFLMAQGVTMAGNLLYGLLCVRLLPIPDYARFAVLFGYMGSLVVLLDIGISNSLAPLVGEKIHDKQLIADYVASLRQIAQRLYLIMAPITCVVFPLLVLKQHWPWKIVTAMTVIILGAAWFARVSSAYGTILILRRDRPFWYRGQMISSLGTLVLLLIFWKLHWLNAFSAILLNVAGIIFTSAFYFFRARKLLGVTGVPSPEKRHSIVRLILPNTPNVIFYALQGQISLMLITIFGHTAGVASVGALSRLAQIFVIFSQMNSILVEPYFAKLPREKLKANYLGALGVIALGCLAISLAAYTLPEIFLWILGPKYATLRFEVMLVVVGSSIRYLSGTMWVIHSSRRFVYWWNNLSTISLTILVQILYLWRADLSTVRNVLYFNIVSAIASLLVNILCGTYGFLKGPRKIEAS